jgi:hypothetical protein
LTLQASAGKQRLVAEVHQRLVGIVVQELLDVFGQADAVIERFGVFGLVIIKLEQKFVGESP